MSAAQRRKGYVIEREIVLRHRELGLRAERVPLSGGARYREAGHDIDIYLDGPDSTPIIAEVKARKSGAGFVTLARWLGENDVLFLRQNNADPNAVLPWKTWVRLLKRGLP